MEVKCVSRIDAKIVGCAIVYTIYDTQNSAFNVTVRYIEQIGASDGLSCTIKEVAIGANNWYYINESTEIFSYLMAIRHESDAEHFYDWLASYTKFAAAKNQIAESKARIRMWQIEMEKYRVDSDDHIGIQNLMQCHGSKIGAALGIMKDNCDKSIALN